MNLDPYTGNNEVLLFLIALNGQRALFIEKVGVRVDRITDLRALLDVP